MPDLLKDLPRLPTEAMTPCAVCERQLLATGLPLFYRVHIKRCGIDPAAINERMGLAMMMGGRQLAAEVMPLADVFASKAPIVVMDDYRDVNVCHDCAGKVTAEDLCHRVMAAADAERKPS